MSEVRTVVPAQLEQDFAKPRLDVLAYDPTDVLTSRERNWKSHALISFLWELLQREMLTHVYISALHQSLADILSARDKASDGARYAVLL
jgi:hypothetical protein